MTESDKYSICKEHCLYPLLNPKSLCIFGANNNLLTTMGSMQLRNIIAGGFKGNIYPIHPKLDEVQGYKAYKSVLDVPETPDIAFIILPPKVVPEVMEECGQKGIKRLIITSGGFRESGEQGEQLSERISQIAEKYDMRFIGPNCLGVYNGWYDPEDDNSRLNTMWIYETFEKGKISIASQSGTIACHTVWHANNMGTKIGKSLSIGNELNIDIVDYLAYFKDDPETEVIGLYIEEIKRGREFIKLAKEITLHKPIIAIYAGGTEAAARSIMSHTGAMGGNQDIYNAVFKETGIISTNSITDFLYLLKIFEIAQELRIYPQGNKVGIITDSGGSGSMMVKSAELYGLEVPEFSNELQEEIRQHIPPTAGARNPIDVTFDMNFYNLFVKFPKLLVKSGEVDAVIVYGVFDFEEVVDVIEESGFEVDKHMRQFSSAIDRAFLKPSKRIMEKYQAPIFFVGPQPYKKSIYQKLIAMNLPVFDFWDQPTKCMDALVKYATFRKKRLKTL
ncbi:MAG: CoA-binding protein [Promethearchaeia archaeon]